mmetsp:Transcript_291/g.257  ORF Transcript_291/g.257 Transcript_291/m.257 type:complete len:83 (-) Transcript_291:658-906(-)
MANKSTAMLPQFCGKYHVLLLLTTWLSAFLFCAEFYFASDIACNTSYASPGVEAQKKDRPIKSIDLSISTDESSSTLFDDIS